jgi:prepilin-type N-terminal cleavage/methylation domain-containing protein
MAAKASTAHGCPPRGAATEGGFSLPELLIAVTILLIISSAVTSGLLQLTNSQRTISNRTEMHAGVRSATELLQQEVGQAGRIAMPGTATLGAAVAAGSQTVGVTFNPAYATWSPAPFFVNEYVTLDAGASNETVQITAVSTTNRTITANFTIAHASGTAINVYGGFGTGIVPPSPGYTNGSDGSHLKMFGDINGDGKMVYVEYFCDPLGGTPGTGNLYRTVLNYDAASKPAPGNSQILVSNITQNPGGTACFTYMPSPLPVVGANTYVLDVAITLTVQTALIDPITKQPEKETKALLNVSPRNVFDVWQLASAGNNTNRLQPIPGSLATSLLP